jgi:hypothetical protein
MTSNHPSQDGVARRTRRACRAAVLVLPAGLVMLASGCFYDEEGSGVLASVRYSDLDDVEITGVSVLDDLDVAVRVNPSLTQTARVTVDDNLLDRGYASVDDGVLEIGFDGLGDIDPSETPRVVLTVRSLDTIENHGDGTLFVTGLDGGSVDVVNTGDGAVAATGEVARVEVGASSEGTVDLSLLAAGTVELSDTDDGEIAVYASDTIVGEISGDADVLVHGDPAETAVELDGDGDLVAA